MSRCERCHHAKPLQAWLTPGGLLLGMLCAGCIRQQAIYQRKALGALAERAPRPPRKARVRRPRQHPVARAIAGDLLRQRDLLRLRAGRLVRDVMEVRRVGACTARIAVAMARKDAGLA